MNDETVWGISDNSDLDRVYSARKDAEERAYKSALRRSDDDEVRIQVRDEVETMIYFKYTSRNQPGVIIVKEFDVH